ncbi:MAG TPA: ribonuclease HII [Acidimicrobiales bacterium]|nr:ribonuclease HII [Acidimicrobiales bacterium]
MTRVEDPTDVSEQLLFASGARYVAGIDEVGRGAWAGPVSVGIAIVDRASLSSFPKGVRDSKMLSEKMREKIFPFLERSVSAYSIGHADPGECDQYGMTEAQRLATERAFANLTLSPDVCIIDGTVNFTGRADAIMIRGADRTVLTVAGASILAKVTRDRRMIQYHDIYPDYEFAKNKGYPSPSHIDALARIGISEIHRKSWSFASSFAPRSS